MPDVTERPLLTDRFEAALVLATQHHAHHERKGTDVPYVAHLLQVAGIVLEAGGDEDTAIAALLHDAVEDADDGMADEARREIRQRFGARVLDIVEGCTDADTQPKPTWEPRKRAYLEHLPKASPDVLLVSSADKLHNARAILRDFRLHGDRLWERFTATAEQTVWYYESLVEAYRKAGGTPVLPELEEVVETMASEVRRAHGPGGASNRPPASL